MGVKRGEGIDDHEEDDGDGERALTLKTEEAVGASVFRGGEYLIDGDLSWPRNG